MPYINDNSGKLNNFAKEPEVYTADSSTQSKAYLPAIIVGLTLIGGLIVLAFVVS